MGSFSIIDLLLLIGIGQGIFLAISISQIQGTFKYANRYLIQIILLATLMLVGKVFGPRFQGEWVIRLAVISDTSIFLFGPLLFSYIISLLKTDSNEGKLRLIHYVPAIAPLRRGFFALCVLSGGQDRKGAVRASERLMPARDVSDGGEKSCAFQ